MSAYRFADASDSSPSGTERTYVRAGTCADLREGVRNRQAGGRGACEGGPAARRRREGPEEIGAAHAAKTTRGLAAFRPRQTAHLLCTVRTCATRCSTISTLR